MNRFFLLNRRVYIALGVLVGIFLALTIVFAVLYGVEKNKTSSVNARSKK
jgi:hypothetical protein